MLQKKYCFMIGNVGKDYHKNSLIAVNSKSFVVKIQITV